mgnify:FL=1
MNYAMTKHLSPNFDVRSNGISIDMLVIHYTGMTSGAAALARLCDSTAKVSAHYLIEEDGRVFQLVDEGNRAWHAGVSCWFGNNNLNDRSIGIELVNPGHEFGYRSFPEAQMQALIGLSRDILARYSITARNVVGHSDVAPTRKKDPGELFDWQALAAAGIGLWPVKGNNSDLKPTVLLTQIGYSVDTLELALKAFQRRYRPHRVDGICDKETFGLLAAVASMT